MLQNYLRVAARNLRLYLSNTILNMLGLGLGIAGAMLIFLFLRYHISTDRHQPAADQLYRVVLDLHLDEGMEHEPGSAYAMASALSKDYSGVEKAGFVRRLPVVTLSSGSGVATRRFMEKENVAYADAGYMELFAFRWLGHHAAASMEEPFTVVVSRKLAMKHFGTVEVAGRILRLDNAHDLKITGVLADESRPTDFAFDAYISLPTLKITEPTTWTTDFSWISSRNFTFVKLRPGTAPGIVERLIARNGKKYYGEHADKYYHHHLQPLSDIHFNENYGGKIRRSMLWILGGVGGFLLVIAGINFINMATAQAAGRSREIGVRKVLGSTRQQLFWQFMVETALLTCLAGLLALLIILPLPAVLNSWTQTNAFLLSRLPKPDVMLFGLAILAMVVLLAGFYPAVIVSGFNPVAALKGRLSFGRPGGFGLRRSLVVVQLIIAQTMITGTVILVMQLQFFRNADLGFDQKAVIKVTLPVQGTGKRESFKNDILQYPEVRSAAFQYDAPTSDMGFGGSVRFDNRADWEKFVVRIRFADADYLKTYQIPLLAGRSFSDRDSVREFIVNEEFMKKLGIRDPAYLLGRSVEDGFSGNKSRIVGVVKSFHLKSLQEGIEPCIIYAQPEQYREIAVRLNPGNISTALSHLRNAWQASYPDEVFNYEFADQKIASFYAKEAQLTSLIRAFAWVAIAICCLGLYGMVSFMVTQKTREIGVRKVLGAGVDSILVLFGKEFMLMILIAFAVSAPLTWLAMNSWLSHFAYRIHLNVWLAVSGGLLIIPVTALTIGYKAVSAALMNPVKSLSNG
ncbi:FtsX-like permease family protein [Dyadobacter sandarakinus]|uniref:ABC transporter permease n=1 Tax=Dyadobacter sandarakinus TaxID=2747268 RepID=A0ABX7I254_9BACT|nr:FtsX-like permease family protein [Dyadobacter sandarakinus]QRQ99859.1 ABC transporter permease [Dyadobacter sandarakinus]